MSDLLFSQHFSGQNSDGEGDDEDEEDVPEVKPPTKSSSRSKELPSRVRSPPVRARVFVALYNRSRRRPIGEYRERTGRVELISTLTVSRIVDRVEMTLKAGSHVKSGGSVSYVSTYSKQYRSSARNELVEKPEVGKKH
eukprot:6676178-Pyramimonas_sp.AAC.2